MAAMTRTKIKKGLKVIFVHEKDFLAEPPKFWVSSGLFIISTSSVSTQAIWIVYEVVFLGGGTQFSKMVGKLRVSRVIIDALLVFEYQ
jgi:hypothetical protein